MTYIDSLNTEIANVHHLLDTIPFSQLPPTRSRFFFNIYKPNYNQVSALNSDDENGLAGKLPINSNKLLKFGISLGNLIKSLQLDEEQYLQQQAQQQQFVSSLNSMKRTPQSSIASTNDPFNDNSTTVSKNNLTMYQIKFIKNLLLLLKNFDIGSHTNNYKQDMPNSTSTSTLNQYSDTSATTNSSPIRLNSKQLLIEKLEINIELDNLFIFKMILKLLVQIYDILKDQLVKANLGQENASPKASNNSDDCENSSIFSYSSLNSSSSKESAIATEEYFRILKQVVARINIGILDPFVKLILSIVDTNVSKDFSNLISNI